MDEFFDFEEATGLPPSSSYVHDEQEGNYQNPGAGFDVDLMLAHAGEDEDSFQILQHFVDTRQHDEPSRTAPASALSVAGVLDLGDGDSWKEGFHVPPAPCEHCHDHKLLCRMSKPWIADGMNVCTSCWASAKYCSFGTRRSADSHAYKETSTIRDQAILDGRENLWDDSEPGCTPRASKATGPSKQACRSSVPKSGPRFSRDTIRILKSWATSHFKHPYPSEQEKEDLRQQTGLSNVQITNWLANARRRGLIRPSRSRSVSSNSASSPMPINNAALASMDPLERWRRSPPEHEPASALAIAQAARSGDPRALAPCESPYRHRPRSENGSAQSGRDSSASSINTAYSGRSEQSFQSHGSFSSFGKRGRRRRRTPRICGMDKIGQGPRQARPYHCTFCVEDFKTKHDWQRHEKSMHLSLERWICAPSGGVTQDLQTPTCVFCQASRPSEDHLETHNSSSCLNKPTTERTFYRKDHLRQHLRLVHNGCLFSSAMEEWKIAAPNIISRCGFCGISLRTWLSRVDHIGEHFKNGATMANWTGDWGLEPNMLKMVENVNIPTIHESSRSGSPFTSNLDSLWESSHGDSWLDNQFEPAYSGKSQNISMVLPESDIEAGLVDYITNSLQRGFCPSDDDLRIRARGIAGLPSTMFDDSVTLQGLKRRCGLDASHNEVEHGMPF